MQERRWATSQGYAAKSARDALQRDTFDAGTAALTAASSSADDGGQCVYVSDRTCLYATPILHYVNGVCMV